MSSSLSQESLTNRCSSGNCAGRRILLSYAADLASDVFVGVRFRLFTTEQTVAGVPLGGTGSFFARPVVLPELLLWAFCCVRVLASSLDITAAAILASLSLCFPGPPVFEKVAQSFRF